MILILAPFTYETYKSVKEYIKDKPSDYRWPEIVDFWFAVFTTVIFMSLERVFQFVLFPWYYKICKEKENEEVRRRRTKKAV